MAVIKRKDEYNLVYAENIITGDNRNIIINSSIMGFMNKYKEEYIVKNFWPITKEEYEAFN